MRNWIYLKIYCDRFVIRTHEKTCDLSFGFDFLQLRPENKHHSAQLVALFSKAVAQQPKALLGLLSSKALIHFVDCELADIEANKNAIRDAALSTGVHLVYLLTESVPPLSEQGFTEICSQL